MQLKKGMQGFFKGPFGTVATDVYEIVRISKVTGNLSIRKIGELDPKRTVIIKPYEFEPAYKR